MVDPDTELDPYEKNLKTMDEREKPQWETRLERQATALYSAGVRHVVFPAGRDYREPLQTIPTLHGIKGKTHRNWKKICDNVYGRSRQPSSAHPATSHHIRYPGIYF